MRLVFKKIRVHNFLSFSDDSLDLDSLGYTVVTGQNNRHVDGAVSNGSGKSAIFNAICFALTGETIQGLSNNLENIYADPTDCWVELELKVDDSDFIIRRYKTPRSDLKVFKDGKDISGKGIKESSKVLENYIPDLTSHLLGSIIILGQGLPYRFADNNPSGRKDTLERLTKSDFMIEAIRNKLDDRQLILKTTLREHEDARVELLTKQAMLESQLKDLKEELNKIEDYNNEYSLQSRILYLNDKILKLRELEDSLKLEIDSFNKESDDAFVKKNKLVTSSINLKSQKCENINLKLSDLVTKLAESKAHVKSFSSEIKKLKNIKDYCPTCGQKLMNVQHVDTTELEYKLEVESEKVILIDKLINSAKDEKSKIELDCDNSINVELTKYDSIISESTEKKQVCSNRVKDVQAKISKSISEQLKVENMIKESEKISASIINIDTALNNIKEDLNSTEESIDDVTSRLRVIQKLITLTKKEFRGVLLENVIDYLNNRVKQYSQKVFKTELLSIELNDNYIDIKYDEKYYESLSGGEKQKIDIIIQLAIRDLLSNQLNLHSNILVLDEVLDFLDSAGSSSILELISTIQDANSVFIISHHGEELGISYDTRINIIKSEAGLSSISVY